LGEVAQMAASQGRGITSLMEHVLAPFAEQMAEATEESAVENADVSSEVTEFDEWDEDFDFSNEEDTALLDEELAQEQTPDKQNIKIAIVGRPNVGKSTLTNRILGEDRVVVYDMPGTTRDSIYIPMERDGQNYTLIDTAGVRKRGKVHLAVEKFSVIKTLQAIQDANVVLLVIDARENISDQDLSLLGFILNAGRSLVIVVNKWDGLDTDVKDRVKSELDRRLDFIDFARVHFISALHGSGVGNLFDSVKEAYECATQKMTTSMLTRILQIAVDNLGINPTKVFDKDLKSTPLETIIDGVGKRLDKAVDGIKGEVNDIPKKTKELIDDE